VERHEQLLQLAQRAHHLCSRHDDAENLLIWREKKYNSGYNPTKITLHLKFFLKKRDNFDCEIALHMMLRSNG
jgi:hypothetical protein